MSSSSSSGSASVAHSSFVGSDGVTKGECAYIDTQGREVKIRYEQLGNQINIIDAPPFLPDPRDAVFDCQEYTRREQERNYDQQRRFQSDIMNEHEDIMNCHPNPFNFGRFDPYRQRHQQSFMNNPFRPMFHQSPPSIFDRYNRY